MFYELAEALLLVTALSLDAFIAFTTYGGRKIRIPAVSAVIICAVCTGVLVLSALLGRLIAPIVSSEFSRAVGFVILLLMGVARVFDYALKAWIKRGENSRRQVEFSAFSLRFLLKVYADPEKADLDNGGTLSASESVLLALALSFDSLGAGFGAGASGIMLLPAALMSFAVGLLSAALGTKLGGFVADRVPFDLSPVAGIMLIALALLR